MSCFSIALSATRTAISESRAPNQSKQIVYNHHLGMHVNLFRYITLTQLDPMNPELLEKQLADSQSQLAQLRVAASQ